MTHWQSGVLPGLLIGLVACGLTVAVVVIAAPSESDVAGRKAAAARWEAEHEATPETWARCRSLCGDAAALLPFGNFGRVQCSCLPSGTVTR